MPTIQPVDAAVSWPADEGAIGVVGVAPWATLEFLRCLYSQVHASKDWHYPRVLCDINTKLPSRGRHFELGERDPSPFIAATIDELAQQGATLAVVPCNTAHILYDRWAADAPIPVPNIVDVTVETMHVKGVRKAAVFASRSLSRHGLYEKALQGAGLAIARLNDESVELISLAIEQVKVTAQVSAALTVQVENLLRELALEGVDGLALGCTELGSLQPLAERYLAVVVESNTALAAAALKGTSGSKMNHAAK
jgi:aspartate racemase